MADNRLRETIREEIRRALRNPMDFPAEFKGWLPRIVEQQITLPSTSVSGYRSAAKTVNELGPTIHGQTSLLAVGSSPYEFVPLTYDAEYGKWVSPTVPHAGGGNSGNITQVLPIRLIFGPLSGISNAKALYDAGLRPQLRLWGRPFNDTGGQTTTSVLTVTGFNVGESGTALGTMCSITGATLTLVASAWEVIPFAITKDFVSVEYAGSVTGGSGSVSDFASSLRWVSA
ncbi:MAG: hypothetical protein M3N29_00810 [Chloroflexota bacterium]|nr:hypothetical protein [Chloroflexota bacterium]